MLYNEGSRRIQRDGTPEKDAGMMLRRMWTVSVCHLKMHEFGRSGERKLMTEISTSPQTALLYYIEKYQTFKITIKLSLLPSQSILYENWLNQTTNKWQLQPQENVCHNNNLINSCTSTRNTHSATTLKVKTIIRQQTNFVKFMQRTTSSLPVGDSN